METKTTTAYSMWRLFRNCRMACKWRYIDELVPLERDPNLAFGSVIHDCLECWHGERDQAKVLDHIDRTCFIPSIIGANNVLRIVMPMTRRDDDQSDDDTTGGEDEDEIDEEHK